MTSLRTALACFCFALAAGCGARSGLDVDRPRDAGSDMSSLRDADIRDAETRDAELRDAELRDAELRDADIRDADVRDADMRDTGLPDAALDARVPDCRDVPSLCDDGTVCTIDLCLPDATCLHTPIVCEDTDPCTADRCDARLGCVFPATDCAGCADGSRDAFLDDVRYPRIAACAGGFANAGLSRAESPTCDRGAGDDGPNPSGVRCSATDLCAPGWHVCLSAGDVSASSPDGCAGVVDAAPRSFFATRQTGPGCGHCATGTDTTCGPNECREGCAQTDRTTNDIFGCGDLGEVPQPTSCGALNRFSNDLCAALGAPWRCDGDPAGLRESDLVVKPGAAGGGVLCCLD